MSMYTLAQLNAGIVFGDPRTFYIGDPMVTLDLTDGSTIVYTQTMTTTIYPLTDYRYPRTPDDRTDVLIYVGEIGASDVGQVQHIIDHEMLNDPKHFHAAFPTWSRLMHEIASDDNDRACNADEAISYLMPDVESWLGQYEGIVWEGGEPYRVR